MDRQIEIIGKSGSRYRYSPLDENRFLPPAGANFVIVRVSDGVTDIVYAGETDNLANQTWKSALEAARQTYGEASILTRLNVTRAVRMAEQADVVEELQPPMNRSEVR